MIVCDVERGRERGERQRQREEWRERERASSYIAEAMRHPVKTALHHPTTILHFDLQPGPIPLLQEAGPLYTAHT